MFKRAVWFGIGIAAAFTFMADAATKQVRYLPLKVMEVCTGNSACKYSTITAALADVSGTSSSSPQEIILAPGDYVEDVTIADSYVTIRGMDRATVRIVGNGGATCTTGITAAVCIPADITGVAFENITLGGAAGVGLVANASGQTTTTFTNVTLGINSGTGTSGAEGYANTGDCIISQDSATADVGKGHNIIIQGSSCYSRQDAFLIGTGDNWRIDNLSVVNNTNNAAASMNVFRETSSPCGITLITNGLSITQSTSGATTSGSMVSFTGQGQTPCTSSTGNFISISNSTLTRRSTGSFTTMRCIYFGTAPADAVASVINLSNLTCDLQTTSGTGTITCLEFDNDDDHSNYTLNANSGTCVMAGGASRTAIDFVDTLDSGVVFNIGQFITDGSSVGSGTTNGSIFYRDTPFTNGVVRGTASAAAPATCAIGDTYADTSGTMCFCSAANTWTDLIAGTTPGGCV